MDTFTIGTRSPWWVRALGRRNPLVRGSDRIEALVLALAVVFSAVAIPIAGAIGTSLHEQRTRIYAREAITRHQVVAVATEEGQLVPRLGGVSFSAEATWSDGGRSHRGEIPWTGRAKVGDQQTIWVNEAGENVGKPPSPSRADSEAIGIALVVWLGAAEASTVLFCLVRRRLNHWRYAQWDYELNASRDNDGRRHHQS
ncbi:MAG TPA: hypothetical protein VL634_09720 [Mycobacterium sp.]|jgi:hypothetical protein|nr:hypothetical protein [Mycobacterium sp.]